LAFDWRLARRSVWCSGLVVRQILLLTLIAIALGLPCALALARFATSILYGVHAHDPVTFTTVPLFLATTLLAC
jgi:hypothetical protein